MKVMIDLFCGLGGASRAFCEDPTWEVIGIDNNMVELRNKGDLHPLGSWHQGCMYDPHHVLHILDELLYECDVTKMVIWASPPCTDFSTKNPARSESDLDTTLLTNTIIVMQELMKKFNVAQWVIENVRGAVTPFKPILGDYVQRIGPFFLWGEFTPLALLDSNTQRHRKPFNKTNSRTPLRGNIHAEVPFAISYAFKTSIDSQTSIMGWVE